MTVQTKDDAYARFLTPEYAENGLATLTQLANLMAQKQSELLEAEEKVNSIKSELTDIQETQIPELMDLLGIGSFKTTTGLMIEIDENIQANISAAKSQEAFNWLRSNNFGALIERKVTLSFGMGEEDKANRLYLKLTEENEDLHIEDKESVHHSRLKSFVKKQLSAGNDIPLDLFGVFKRRTAKIKV